jgi:hypothetical protein
MDLKHDATRQEILTALAVLIALAQLAVMLF